MEDTDLANFNWYRGNLEWLPSRTIFLTKHGSHAYGTNTPESDLDFKGIAIAPREYYLGFLKSFEQAEVREPIDAVIYDVRKFFKLAAECNPNIMEVLFTDTGDWIKPAGNYFLYTSWYEIWSKRELFLSQKARHTFSGYAVAQLKRLQSHRGWLLTPPKKQPERQDFGLKNGGPTIGKEQLGVVEARIRKAEDGLAGQGLTKDQVETERLQQQLIQNAITELDLDMRLLPIIYAERRYATACRHWQSYQKWKTERNPKRAEMEAKCGFDAKNAMHLVRLLRMAKEILGEGKVIVRRPDAEELLAIRAGAWSYEQLIEWANKAEAELQEIALKSPLPKEPDRKKLDELLVSIVEGAIL